MPASAPAPDPEFVDSLRAAVDAYLAAIDAWEAEYRRYYRMPGVPVESRPDLAAQLRLVDGRRRDLDALIPRARRLCLKHQIREPFSSLLRVDLGRYSPQERADSAIGRSERNTLAATLIDLKSHCQTWTEGSPTESDSAAQGP